MTDCGSPAICPQRIPYDWEATPGIISSILHGQVVPTCYLVAEDNLPINTIDSHSAIFAPRQRLSIRDFLEMSRKQGPALNFVMKVLQDCCCKCNTISGEKSLLKLMRFHLRLLCPEKHDMMIVKKEIFTLPTSSMITRLLFVACCKILFTCFLKRPVSKLVLKQTSQLTIFWRCRMHSESEFEP